MKKINTILIAFALILVAFLVFWLSTQRQTKEVEINYEKIVEQYIKDNISELSPQAEALGGTFYVTNINFLEDNIFFVDYEDGHIVLEAEAKYSVINNEIIIDYFRLTENEIIELEDLNDQDLVSGYILENISELSPTEAVLGGTFYVTNLNFIDNNSAIVEYEDGHIALKAQATYSIINNQVLINSFTLIQEEIESKEEISENDLVTLYIEENISQLSPTETVLGGTFYVTNLNFIDNNSAIVEYEDGHIALQAEATYSILDNQVVIESFQIIEEETNNNEELVGGNDLVTLYIEENISQLSPTEAVLGGTFYVTNLNFIDNNSVIVDYEDGHIALQAVLTYIIENNEVMIETFNLVD